MENYQPMTIGQRTGVTFGLLIPLVGGVAWLTDIKFQGSANADELRDVKSEQAETRRSIKRVEKAVFAILQKLRIPEPRE